MADPQLKKVACPSCGAPLLFGPGEITVRCPFCHAVVERPAAAGGPATLRSDSDGRPRRPANPRPSTAASSPVFLPTMIILGMLVALSVGGLAVFFIVQQVSRSGFNLSVNGPVAVLSTETPDEPEFISLAFDVTGSAYLLNRMNPVRKQVVWRGKKFESISDVRLIVAGGGKFFTIEGTKLHAYSDKDGSELWQAKLSDALGYCRECLSVSGDRAIALTQDYVIQAFDTDSGASAWKRRMDGYTQGFLLADDSLWVIDKTGDRLGLLQLSLEDGTVRQEIAPVCRRKDALVSSELSTLSTFLFDPDPAVRASDRSLYLLYGWMPGCVERWDVSPAAMRWQTEDDHGYSPSGDVATLLTPDTLFFSYEHTLWSVSKADGQTRVLSEDGDYELVPLALEQGTLIVRTKRTRGTTQFGLRGVDPAGGETLWEYPIENGEPVDPPDAAFGHVDKDGSVWGWRMIDGRLRLFLFQADPNQVTFDTLDPKDGTSSGTETLALPIDGDSYFGPDILAWKGTVVWFAAGGKIMGVDISTAKLKCAFP
jgi:LSD1 subclass zinc finger protein